MSDLRAGRAEAAEVIWNWEEPRRAGRGKASDTPSRAGGVLYTGIGFAIAALFFFFGSRTIASVVFGVSSFVLLAALASPDGLYAGIHRGFRALGRAIGRVIVWSLMPLLFYLFFLPFGVLFRRGSKDRLRRFFDPDAASYWEPHEGFAAGSADRNRQY